ncbi:hypothetical protein D9M68_168170 [compost metagenome]
MVRRHQHGLVAGDIGLRRQHVHALRTRRARRGFQRKGGDVRGGHARVVLGVEGIEHADQHGVRLHLRQLGFVRCAHLQHQLRAQRLGGAADARARGLIGAVGLAGTRAGASLQYDLVALCHVFLHGLRRCGNARLPRPRLSRDPYLHFNLLWSRAFRASGVDGQPVCRAPHAGSTARRGAGLGGTAQRGTSPSSVTRFSTRSALP